MSQQQVLTVHGVTTELLGNLTKTTESRNSGNRSGLTGKGQKNEKKRKEVSDISKSPKLVTTSVIRDKKIAKLLALRIHINFSILCTYS